jgi:hypothetical protein
MGYTTPPLGCGILVGEGTFESDIDVTWEGPSGEVVYEDTWPGRFYLDTGAGCA